MGVRMGSVVGAGLLLAATVCKGASCEGVISNRAPGDNPAAFWPDSYTILFNDPVIGVERVVLPPDPALKGKVPFPEHSNGQTREEIKQLLKLRGTVKYILDAINGISIITDEVEARALSCDPRVKLVEQAALLAADVPVIPSVPAVPVASHVNHIHASDVEVRPIYDAESATLHLPLIDTQQQAGQYQNAEMQLEQSGTWRLVSTVAGKLANFVESVEVIQTSSFPVQVFLRIGGRYPMKCSSRLMLQPVTRPQSNHFSVNLYEGVDPYAGNCGITPMPFQLTVPLPVYGLGTGVYHYKVNGGFPGTFTLTRPNRLDQ